MTKNGIADKLVANFSTTTKESRVVSEIVLMDAMQKYFEYELDSECGIPEIRITGEKEDWMNLISKANQIAELIPNFSFWIESFNEILQHFLDVYDDKIDNNFGIIFIKYFFDLEDRLFQVGLSDYFLI